MKNSYYKRHVLVRRLEINSRKTQKLNNQTVVLLVIFFLDL